MKYVRFLRHDVEGTSYFSDILSDACTLYVHNKMLKEKNGFLLKGGFVYVSTLRGLLGVHLENEQITLTHHIPNMVAVKCNEENIYKFKVGKRYIRITSDGEIVLTVFRRWATPFIMKHVHVIECESCESCTTSCLTDTCLFGWLKNL